MNNIIKVLKNKLVELTIKKNRLLGKLGFLSERTESFGTIKEIYDLLGSSKIALQLHKEDIKDKDYIFSLIDTLTKNGIKIELIEFDKIFSSEDIKRINEICKTTKISFRYVFPNFWSGKNATAEIYTGSYVEVMKKVWHLTKVATANFRKREEQVVFIADQISKYTNYDFEALTKSKEDHIRLSSLQACLEDRKTICAGIAFTFERCMTELGIPNMLVLGYSGENKECSVSDNNHVWNKVKIDNKWYNVDVTNLLPIPALEGTNQHNVSRYVLKSDQSMENEGSTITDYYGIPKSEEDFPDLLEIYDKIRNIKSVLEEYDKGNTSTILKYQNPINPKKEKEYDEPRKSDINKEPER